jgi:hypothetical protein
MYGIATRLVRLQGLPYCVPGSMPEVGQNPIANNSGLQQNGLRTNPGEGIRGERKPGTLTGL